MTEPEDVKRVGAELIAGLQAMDPDIRKAFVKAFGRQLEFVIVAWDRGRIDENNGLPIAYHIMTFSNQREALDIAARTLTQALEVRSDAEATPVIKLH